MSTKMNYPDDFVNKIICGDCLEVMKDMPDKCVDMILTSPPYDNLRDYNGYNFDFKKTANELLRILNEGAVMVWVVGDSSINGDETGTSFRQALYFKEVGLNLFDTMIYQKRGGLMTGSIVGYSQKFEYMFVFSKGKITAVNLIKDVPVKYNESRIKKHRRKDGTFDIQHWKIGGMTRRGNIWIYDVGYQKTTKDKIAFKHPAIFPDALARDHIISWSNKNSVVFDPFVGSGTTTKVAKNLHRNFIGIEINPEYCKIAEERLAQGVL